MIRNASQPCTASRYRAGRHRSTSVEVGRRASGIIVYVTGSRHGFDVESCCRPKAGRMNNLRGSIRHLVVVRDAALQLNDVSTTTGGRGQCTGHTPGTSLTRSSSEATSDGLTSDPIGVHSTVLPCRTSSRQLRAAEFSGVRSSRHPGHFLLFNTIRSQQAYFQAIPPPAFQRRGSGYPSSMRACGASGHQLRRAPHRHARL